LFSPMSYGMVHYKIPFLVCEWGAYPIFDFGRGEKSRRYRRLGAAVHLKGRWLRPLRGGNYSIPIAQIGPRPYGKHVRRRLEFTPTLHKKDGENLTKGYAC